MQTDLEFVYDLGLFLIEFLIYLKEIFRSFLLPRARIRSPLEVANRRKSSRNPI